MKTHAELCALLAEAEDVGSVHSVAIEALRELESANLQINDLRRVLGPYSTVEIALKAYESVRLQLDRTQKALYSFPCACSHGEDPDWEFFKCNRCKAIESLAFVPVTEKPTGECPPTHVCPKCIGQGVEKQKEEVRITACTACDPVDGKHDPKCRLVGSIHDVE
jgi:hypothetical protein